MDKRIIFRQYIKPDEVKGTKIGDEFHFWGYIHEEYPNSFTTPMSMSNNDGTVQPMSDRFTGMVDKNGTKIFENDITTRGIVTYHDCGFMLGEERVIASSGGRFRDMLGSSQSQFIEVTGNIHQSYKQ